MSADTTMVIAVYNFGTAERPQMMYATEVVQAAEDLQDDSPEAVEMAKAIFLRPHQHWFTTLGRAKSLASILREETYIEYPTLLIIEITQTKVLPLTRHGKHDSWQNRDRYRPQPSW